MGVKVAPLVGPGIGVRVEVNHPDRARPDMAGDRRDARVRDRVVASQDDRDRASICHPEDLLVDNPERALKPSGHDRRVTGIHHLQVRIRFSAGLDGPGPAAAPCGGRHPDRPGAEPGSLRDDTPSSKGAPTIAASAPLARRAASLTAQGSFSNEPCQSE